MISRRVTLWTIAAAAVMCLTLGISSHAEAAQKIEVYSDKQQVEFAIDPMIEDGTTRVQLRPLFESLGIELEWNSETKTITGIKGDSSFTLPIGSMTAHKNGQAMTLIKPAQIIGGHTVVPLRFVGEATGAVVGWNGAKQVINLYSDEYVDILGLTQEEAQNEVNEAAFVNDSYHPSGLKGLYASGSADLLNRNNCSGVCWDYYYFMNDRQLITQMPEHGWESVDCAIDNCLHYEVKEDTLLLDNGVSRSLKLLEGGSSVIIGGDTYTHYEPYQRLKLEGKYVSSSYTSNWSGIGFSSVNEFYFHPDGTFSDDSWLGVLTDGSEFGDGSGVSNTLTANSQKAGTYAVINHMLLLRYKDGTTETRMFFLPDKDFEFMRIGGKDFFFVETNFPPYEDKLTRDQIADKTIFSEWNPEREQVLERISITLDGYQWAELAVHEQHLASFNGFPNGDIVAMTAKYTIRNQSNQSVDVNSLQAELYVGYNSGKILETTSLAPDVEGELKPGEELQKMAVFLMPTDVFNRFDEFDMVISGLQAITGQEVFGERALSYNIWTD